MLKRLTLKNSANKTLVGHLHAVDPARLIIFVHGFLGDKSSRGRFDYYVDPFNAAGFSVFAFDFSGCGESEDTPLSLASQCDDLACVIAAMKERGFEWVGLMGNSLGGLISLKSYSTATDAIALTGGVTGKMPFPWKDFFALHQISADPLTGGFRAPSVSAARAYVALDSHMMDEFDTLDVSGFLKQVACPVLLIHGDTEIQEERLGALSLEALPLLPVGSKHVVIPGAKHGFWGFWDQTLALLIPWFEAAYAARSDKLTANPPANLL